MRKNVADFRAQHRRDILEKCGGKCVKCGFSDLRALQFDHVNGGGRRLGRPTFTTKAGMRETLEAIVAGELQILCANCNWIKREENKEVGKYVARRWGKPLFGALS